MKKTLLFLASLLMTMGAFAQKTATFDFTGDNGYGMTLLSGSTQEYNPDPTTCVQDDVTLTLNGQTRWWKTSSANELRFYKGSDMVFSVPEGNVITKIELAVSKTKFDAAVGTFANGVWTGSQNSVTLACNIESSRANMTTITVTYQSSSAPSKKDPELSFSATEATAYLGEAFSAPSLSLATTASVAYSSSNPEVATVNAETGEVTILALGETKITATAAENDEYSAGSASYTLTVKEPVKDVVNEPYKETFSDDFGSFTLDNVSLGEGLTYVWNIDTKYKYAKASAYVNKTNIASESWLVSPWINVENGNLYFQHAISKFFGTVADEATVWIKVKDGDWKQVSGITFPEIETGKNFSSFLYQTVNLSEYAGKTIKVGFKYVSTSSAAGTWEIKNFEVTPNDPTGINVVEAAQQFDANAPVYNLAGQRVNSNAKGILIQNGKKFVK